ncbi:DoxX family protein [Kineococcus gynurae]|uniref:DoxX family protein n=1 Tax=Kineococcus gynurae TaxID=452979 RepID=A0ABV5LMS6_9ACTN
MTSTTAPPSGTLTVTRPSTGHSLGLLALRLVAGAVLLTHGIPKLTGLDGVTAAAAGSGVPAPEIAGILVVAGEIGLGVLLLLGLATRVAGGLLLVQMVLTWVFMHSGDGLFIEGQLNGENAVLLAAIGATLLLTGPGRVAVDAALRRRRA